jgi:hypothetical protein
MDSHVPLQSRASFKRLQVPFSIALGLFITFQALFLPLANLLEFQPRLRILLANKPWAKQWVSDWLDKKGGVFNALEKADSAGERWQELTGQSQRWSLFAPEVADDIWFMGVIIHQNEIDPSKNEDENPSEGYNFTYLSDNEPADPNHFFRIGNFRIRRYEMALEVHLYDYSSKTAEQQAEAWRDDIREKVRKYWDNMEAYLRYRLQCFKRFHPDLPEPRELILTVRHYVIPPPEKSPFRWGEPEEVPIARWRPAEPPSEETLPIERYDPVTKRFVPVYR